MGGTMSIVLVGSTSGSITLQEPAVAGSNTISLPAATGTAVLTGVSGTVDINAAGSNNVTLSTNSTERVRVDSSGNVGIGNTTIGNGNKLSVTGVIGFAGATIGTTSLPSAAHVSSSTLRFGVRGSLMTSDDAGLTAVGTYLSNNIFFRNASGNPGYITTSTASQIALIDDTIRFRRAASGTADTDTSFTETMRINSNGNIVLQGGTITASGVGITFPATQSASSDANCLDDYEEGTWTPSYGGGITAATYGSARAGTYIKIGRSVTVHFVIMTDSVTRGSGGVTITGLPFTSSNATGSEASLSISNATRFDSNPPLYARVALNSTTIVLYSSINATGAGTDPVEVAPTNLNTGSGNRNIFIATVTYFTS